MILADRSVWIVGASRGLRTVVVARDEEVLDLTQRRHLFGSGIGYIDARLLAAVLPAPGTALATRDRRLRAAASLLKIAVDHP